MALPDGVEPRSAEKWMEIAKGKESLQRKPIIEALRLSGVSPTTYMQWSAEQKVTYVMELQGETPKKTAGASAKTSGVTPKTAASNGTAAGGGDAKLSARIEELSTKVDELTTFIRDAHYLVRVLVQSNADVAANVDDTDLQDVIYGKLAVPGNA